MQLFHAVCLKFAHQCLRRRGVTLAVEVGHWMLRHAVLSLTVTASSVLLSWWAGSVSSPLLVLSFLQHIRASRLSGLYSRPATVRV